MTNTTRNITAFNGSAPNFRTIRAGNDPAICPEPESLHATAITNGCQDPNHSRSSAPRLLLFDGTGQEIPEALRQRVIKADCNALVLRTWESVTSCRLEKVEVIIDCCNGIQGAIERIDEVWKLRMRTNYSLRPAYLVITKTSQPASARFQIHRRGGRILHLRDVADQFKQELEQIRLALGPLSRSLPRWSIVYEGNGNTLQAQVYFKGSRPPVRICAADRPIAALAVFIKHNGIARSLSAWRKILADDLLFKPAGGGFDLPSLASIKMYLHRDFPRCLQEAFDAYRSGFCADHIIENIDPGTHRTKYRIRGEWEAIRR